jgi:hypothetical protein
MVKTLYEIPLIHNAMISVLRPPEPFAVIIDIVNHISYFSID